MSRRVLYVAFGDKFIKEMLFSAECVKRHCPDMQMTVFTDRQVGPGGLQRSCRLVR